jgi:CRP-like cAMP-binding protein
MSPRENALLHPLDPATFSRIEPHLSVIELHRKMVLAEAHRTLDKVYFPHSGIISCVVGLRSGDTIQTGMIGNDGEYGAGHALDNKMSLNNAVVQVAGTASVMASDELRKLANELPPFKELLVNYEQFFLAQVQQTAACNAVHNIQSRTCRWLLRMHDLAGLDLSLTHEFLAEMMGVRRTSVTGIAILLQEAGMISYSRGHIHLKNVHQIEHSACECNDDLRSHYRRLFGFEWEGARRARRIISETAARPA